MNSNLLDDFSQVMSPTRDLQPGMFDEEQGWGREVALGAADKRTRVSPDGEGSAAGSGAMIQEAAPPGLRHPESAGAAQDATTSAAAGRRAPARGVGASTAEKVKIAMRPLDASKPEDYEGWRYALKAELMAAGPAAYKMTTYLNAIEDPNAYPASRLQREIDADPDMSAVDTKLFAAILSCLCGSRRPTVEERIRAQVTFGSGAQTLRCLDSGFRKGGEHRALAATRELLGMQPSGKWPAAHDKFFTRYRLLLQQAGGANFGRCAQIDVLRRAAEDHPRLGLVWATWKHADGADPHSLLARLEDTVYDAMHEDDTRAKAGAWAAGCAESEHYDGPSAGDLVLGQAAAVVDQALASQGSMRGEPKGAGKGGKGKGGGHGGKSGPRKGAGRSDVECWTCGKVGHRSFECQAAGNAAVLEKLEEVMTLLRGIMIGTSKKE